MGAAFLWWGPRELLPGVLGVTCCPAVPSRPWFRSAAAGTMWSCTG